MAVLESGNNEFHPGILDKSKRDYGLPKRVLKSDPIISTSLSSKLDGCETGFEKMNVLMDPAVNTELSPHKDMTLGETGKTFSESITVTRNDESAIPAEQNRRRETFIITSPSCQAGVENKKQENIVDRRGTFIVPKVTSESTDANSKVSTNAEPVNAASKKRNTFCVPKVCSVSNKPKDMVEDEVGRTTSETLGDDLLLSKQQSTITSQTVHMDQAVFKHPGVIGISKPAHKNKSVTKSLTTAASQSPSESKTVHDPPCVVNSDSCADDDPHVNDEHTIYFNNDMDLTEVVDVSIQSQSSSEQNNPAEKKSKPPVCLRLSKPGKITFTASRKENDGTRKIVPSKVPTIRSKSKKQLRQLQQAIAADQSQPNNIFDFHDKTPSHLQEKASVFDVSLNESATVTQPNVDVYKERLLKLTAKVHSGKDSDVMFTDSRESGSNSETKCSEDMNQNRTHISSSGGESKGKEKVKKSQTKSKVLNEALENEDQNEIDGSSSTKSSDTLSIKCMGEPSGNNSRSRSKKKKNEPLADKNTVDDIDFVSVIPEKQRRTKSRTRTKSKSVESTDDSGHGEDSSSGMKSLHKNSLVKKALSGEASNNKRTEDVSSQLKDENKEKGNKRSQMTEPVTTVGGSVKLLSDACPLYSLPLKGSPDCSLSTSKRRKSKVENSPDGNMRRTRSCSRKRVDYTEVDSETSVSPEKKCRVRSRGRSLKKKSPTNKRNRSRKQGDYSDCESTHSEKVTDENREQNTECPKNSKSGLSQVCPLETSMLLQSESDVYSLPLKASPAAKKREDGRLRNRSRSAHNLVTRRVRSQSLKRAVHSEKDNEETDNTAEPSNVVKSAPSPTAKTLSCRNSLTSRVSGVNVIGDDTSVQNNDTVNAADMQEKCKQRSPFRSVVDTGPRFSDIQAVDDLSVERSSVYRLPLKGSPDGKVKLASSRRSMSCGSVTRSSSQSRKKCQEPSQDDGPRRSRSCKRVIPLDITSDESDDSSPAPVAVRTPHSAEKSKARSRGRLKKRQSLSKMRSKSRKRLAVGSNEDVSCLETVNRDGEESTSEADGTTFKADKRSPKAYVIKKNPEKLTKKTLVTDSLDVFKLTAKQSPDRLKKHTDSFRKKKSVVDFLTMLDKSDSSIADSVTNVDSPGDKSKTENVNDTCDTKKTLKMTSVKSCKMGKQKLGLQSKTTKPQSRGEPFRWTPCVSPRNTTSPRTWKKHRESEAKKPHQEVDRKTETLKTYKERETEKSHMECEVRKSHRENENGKSHRESEVRKSVRENESRKSYKESEARKPQRESDAEKPHSKTKAEESYKESETEKSYKESKAGNAYRESEARKSHIENETKKIHTESEIKKDSVRQVRLNVHDSGGNWLSFMFTDWLVASTKHQS